MKIRRTLEKLSVLLLITFVMFSCEPEKDVFTAFEVEGIDVNEVLDELVEDSQKFDCESDMLQQLITSNETIITIPANVFQTKSGAGVSGVINLEVRELYSKGEIFLNQVPTVSDGRLIASDAVIHISATKDGEELELIPGKQIQLQVPNDNPEDKMELFYGDENSRETFDWVEADGDESTWDNVQQNEWIINDTLEGAWGFGYDCFPEELDWINIDVFVDVPEDQKTSVCVELPEIYTNKNTVVSMVFKDINSVVGFVGKPDEMQFCEPYGLTPLGYDVTFLVFSAQEEDLFHFATLDATITENLVVNILPEEKSKEEIKMILEGL